MIAIQYCNTCMIFSCYHHIWVWRNFWMNIFISLYIIGHSQFCPWRGKFSYCIGIWYTIYILHQYYIYVFSIHKVFLSLLQTLEIVVMFCYIWSVAKILRQTKCLRVEKKVRWFTTKSFFRIFSSGSNTWHLVRDNPVCNILSKKQIKTSFIFYNILWR